MRVIISKILASVVLLYMLWLTVCCPCDRLLCCHLGRFWIALVVLVAVVFFENGFKAVDMSCG